MKILPIGSIIKVDNIKLMVSGHFSKEEGDKNQYYYVCLPYPIGYVNKEKIVTVKVETEVEVLHEGYQTERGNTYTEQLSKVSELSVKELAFYGRLASEAMKNMKGDN